MPKLPKNLLVYRRDYPTKLRFLNLGFLGVNACKFAAYLLQNPNQLSLALVFLPVISWKAWKKIRAARLRAPVASSGDSAQLQSAATQSFVWPATVLQGVSLVAMTQATSGLQVSLCFVLSMVSLVWFALGSAGLQSLRTELFLLTLFAIESVVVPLEYSGFVEPLQTTTARLATFFLWCSGQAVSTDGTLIYLKTAMGQAGVDVRGACAGLRSMVRLVYLGILFLSLVPVARRQAVLVLTVGPLISWVINALRVSLMAFLSAYGRWAAFEYWHKGQGSNLFSLVTVLLFGLFLFQVVLPAPERSH